MSKKLKKEDMKDSALTREAVQWFSDQGWKPFPFQRRTWKALLEGRNGLLNAPTGSGKTYALWIPIALEIFSEKQTNQQRERGLKAVWVTPMRALSLEIAQAATRFCEGIGISLQVGIRTGDTSQKERAAQKKAMPDLLITTPESLQLLLATKGYSKLFQGLQAFIVDEWHELLGTKRGVQMELALSRLRHIIPGLRIWGISATIGNLEQAREILLGPGSPSLENSVLIRARIKKKFILRSILPQKMERFPWRGHLGLDLIDQVIRIIKASSTTLLFTNTRAQCEIWFQKLLQESPEFAGELAMHHGSIGKETRIWVEQAIREGSLKAVVATSTLDLGVDFPAVDTVIQIGGPKGVARFLQRAGRSGHSPGQASVLYFLPTHAIELVEASALRKAVKRAAVEERHPYLLCFDVLVQYLTTLAVSDGFYPKEIWPEVQSCFCFKEITREQWRWVLNFITKGSQSLETYDEYKKVEISENGLFQVNDRGIAIRHRLQIGTIVSDAALPVKYLRGGYIGSIEEGFIARLRPGEVFTFAGRNLELIRVKDMQVLVRISKKKSGKVPHWAGGRMAFSARMSDLLREEMYVASASVEGKATSPELRALRPILLRQQQESIIPSREEFLIETFRTREGYHMICYPFEGRFAHEAMASILAFRISLLKPVTFSIAFNDYGFELLSDQKIDVQEVLDNALFSSVHLVEDLNRSLNATEMARRKFRDIAVIAGMVFLGFPHKLVKTRHLQGSAQLLFSVFRDYEPDNLLYLQAFRETFEHQLEQWRIFQAFERISRQKIIWKACGKPSPFSFPIITDRLREKLSSEKLEDRIRKMLRQLEQ